MAEPSSSQEIIDLALRMGRLESQARELSRTARKRMIGTRIVGIIILLFIVIYLSYAYRRFSALDAQMVANSATTMIQDNLPNLRRSLQEELKNDAGKYVGMLEDQAKELPKTASLRLREEFRTRAEAKIKEVEPEVEQLLKESLAKTRKQLGGREIDEEQAKLMITDAVGQFKKDATVLIDKVYDEYAQLAKEIAHYLEMLATNSDLDERQKIHRNVIIAFLAVMGRHDLDFKIDLKQINASKILSGQEGAG